MCTRTGHKPVGYSQKVSLTCYHKPESLIEINVRLPVGLQICNCSAGIHMHTECRQQGGSDSLMLERGFNSDRSQMPVRLSRIAMCPCSGPLSKARHGSEWIAEYNSGQHAKFSESSELTRAGSCHATDPHKGRRDKRRKLAHVDKDRAVRAGTNVPALGCGNPRPLLRRPERAWDCRAWPGQGSELRHEDGLAAVRPVLLSRRFSSDTQSQRRVSFVHAENTKGEDEPRLAASHSRGTETDI
jgi:hypothetical protein